MDEVAASSSNALDTRSWGDKRTHSVPALEPKTSTPLDAARPREAGPPGQWSCLEAVMDYLDGPFALDFDFMFADEDGGCEVV